MNMIIILYQNDERYRLQVLAGVKETVEVE